MNGQKRAEALRLHTQAMIAYEHGKEIMKQQDDVNLAAFNRASVGDIVSLEVLHQVLGVQAHFGAMTCVNITDISTDLTQERRKWTYHPVEDRFEGMVISVKEPDQSTSESKTLYVFGTTQCLVLQWKMIEHRGVSFKITHKTKSLGVIASEQTLETENNPEVA